MNSLEAHIMYLIASIIISLILFVSIDLLFNLPNSYSVRGVDEISEAIARHGGDKAGGTMMANLVCSPDGSAGTFLAACGFYIAGIPGGLLGAVFAFLGNEICHDRGYAAFTGAVLTTTVIAASTHLGFSPSTWIPAVIISVVIVQGISHTHASHILGKLWRLRKRQAKEDET